MWVSMPFFTTFSPVERRRFSLGCWRDLFVVATQLIKEIAGLDRNFDLIVVSVDFRFDGNRLPVPTAARDLVDDGIL